MSFSGKYELESQENYEDFLEVIGLQSAKTDHKVVTEVAQDGEHFTWKQSIPNWNWTFEFTLNKESELTSMKGTKFSTKVTLVDGKISVKFPEYDFTGEIIDDKLVMTCVTPGEKGVAFRRVSRRI